MTTIVRKEDAVGEMIAPEAPIRFIGAFGDTLGEMGGPFTGRAGYIEGWTEWLAPWETFELTVDDVVDVDASRVLILTTTHGRLAGSDVQLSAPAAAIFTFAGASIVAIDHYLDREVARRDAGLAE